MEGMWTEEDARHALGVDEDEPFWGQTAWRGEMAVLGVGGGEGGAAEGRASGGEGFAAKGELAVLREVPQRREIAV
jgi:hypothetical protein